MRGDVCPGRLHALPQTSCSAHLTHPNVCFAPYRAYPGAPPPSGFLHPWQRPGATAATDAKAAAGQPFALGQGQGQGGPGTAHAQGGRPSAGMVPAVEDDAGGDFNIEAILADAADNDRAMDLADNGPAHLTQQQQPQSGPAAQSLQPATAGASAVACQLSASAQGGQHADQQGTTGTGTAHCGSGGQVQPAQTPLRREPHETGMGTPMETPCDVTVQVTVSRPGASKQEPTAETPCPGSALCLRSPDPFAGALSPFGLDSVLKGSALGSWGAATPRADKVVAGPVGPCGVVSGGEAVQRLSLTGMDAGLLDMLALPDFGGLGTDSLDIMDGNMLFASPPPGMQRRV